MIAKAFTRILFLFVPIIIIFTVYRATMNLGPFSFKYVFDTISNEFLSTTNFFVDMVNDLSSNMGRLLETIRDFWDPNYYEKLGLEENFWTTLIVILLKVFWIPMQMIQLVINGLFNLFGLIVVFVSDFISVLKVLSRFVFGVSPYSVEKYFPVP